MAASAILTKTATPDAFVITLASLASGSARQSTLESNSGNYPAAFVNVRIKSGAAAPNVGTTYDLYLLRSDGTITDDAAGASDAAITIENAPLLGTIVVTASANKNFYGVFDTATLGPLGSLWAIAIVNRTSQAMSSTEVDHAVRFTYYYPEAQ